ncbi:MAG: PLP-dependent cysteine synthase family protein [Gemmatimonadota bacterium]|nr:PLP-dependent cysteine synthase family protein [Gemmatimonadota bacterium]
MTIPTLTSRQDTDRASPLEAIGDTPLWRLRGFEAEIAPVELYAKAEHLNPGRSVKDRPALRMILEGERSGELEPGKRILDATSGNTGIALSWIGAARGYPVTLCIPENASPGRLATLRALGAELVLTDAQESHDGAYHEARRRAAGDPDRYWYANQYDNPANWRAHYETTGPEIREQTGGRASHLVAGIGTSGTLTGAGRFLRERRPDTELVAVQPSSPMHGLEGLKHLETAFHPAIWDPDLADRTIAVSTEEAQETVRRLAREDGILVGPSSGANVWAALEVARDLDEGVVVTVLCDDGRMYLGESFWEEASP